MKILIAVPTFNRLEYTKRCLQSINETLGDAGAGDDYYIVVVDNASTDMTVDWLLENSKYYDKLITRKANGFPGAACNQAWMMGLIMFPDATHLCRIDNDCVMHPGWFTEVKELFSNFDDLGQVGLMEMKDTEFPVQIVEVGDKMINVGPSNIGGPNVIDRKLWDLGLRYDEMPWQNFGSPTAQEDVALSLAVKAMGKRFGNFVPHLCTELSYGNTSDYPEYYRHTFTLRGHPPPAMTKDGVVLEEGWRDHV